MISPAIPSNLADKIAQWNVAWSHNAQKVADYEQAKIDKARDLESKRRELTRIAFNRAANVTDDLAAQLQGVTRFVPQGEPYTVVHLLPDWCRVDGKETRVVVRLHITEAIEPTALVSVIVKPLDGPVPMHEYPLTDAGDDMLRQLVLDGLFRAGQSILKPDMRAE